MRVLIACEFSGRVRDAFRARGHDAWSCDLLPSESPYPVSIISSQIRKPDQIIQPWQFGDSYQKTTCLWLDGVPPLRPTKVVDRGEFVTYNGKTLPKWYSSRRFNRSITFPGIAEAMASQWG
jgi:hypothetical protein